MKQITKNKTELNWWKVSDFALLGGIINQKWIDIHGALFNVLKRVVIVVLRVYFS